MRRVLPVLSPLLFLALATVPAVASSGGARGLAASPPARASVEKATEGQVVEHAAGLHLTLRTDDGKTVTFRLDEKGLDAKVAPDVAVGVRARVVESRLPDGKRSLSATVVAAPAARP